MKGVSVLGSTFEMSLRILLMLDELSSLSLDEQQIVAVDFISVYAADFGLLDENLHGYNNYRYGEYPARRAIVKNALNNLVLDGNIKLLSSDKGYKYHITEAGKTICQKLDSDYIDEYRIAVNKVSEKFMSADIKVLVEEINKRTINSLGD